MKSYSSTTESSSRRDESLHQSKAALPLSRDDDRARLLAAVEDVRRHGLAQADRLLRLGAAKGVERCILACEQRPDAGPGLLARMLLDGFVVFTEPAANPSRMLRAMWAEEFAA